MNNFEILKPFNKNGLSLKNRVVMSAMTRNFADKNHCPTDSMLHYYERRAINEIGLILTEGVIIDLSGDGYPDVPYIITDEQISRWKLITSAVQKHNTKIFCQLWHCGRISHPEYLGGETPVSSSAIKPDGMHSRINKPYVTPRALETSEVKQISLMFKRAALNAIKAGFDGVEIHGGHGYIIDQFLDSRINKRKDKYGGSIENRCRLLLETTASVLDAVGPERTALRISPSREMDGLYEWPDLNEMLDYVIPALDSLGLKILDVSCARSDYYKTSGKIIREIRSKWPHIIMGGASLNPEVADEEIKKGLIDLVTYGRFILANPDFVKKIRKGENLVPFEAEMLKNLY